MVCPACGASRPAPHQKTPSAPPSGLDKKPRAAAFQPPPRVPAPLKVARPPAGFVPDAGVIIKPKAGRFGLLRRKEEPKPAAPVEGAVEVFDEDQMPSWVYQVILLGSIISFLGAYAYWNSSSPIIGPGWKTWALGIMIASGILGLIVAYRLGRKEEYGRRTAEFARRRRQGAVRMVKGTARGVANVGRGIRSGGIQFREGFQEGKRPNFIVRFIQFLIRTVVRTINGVISLVRWVFRTFFFLYVFVVRLAWRLYRYIAEPVLILAWRIARWALKVTYRVARWALNVVWRVFYWIVRRWPLKYATNALEEPVRYHVRPMVLTTNVVVSEFLGAPVRAPVRLAAEPHVLEFRTRHQTKKAVKLLEREERHEHERHLWYKIPTPEERLALRMEKKRVQAEERRIEEQHKAEKRRVAEEAKKRDKEEKRRAKEEGRTDELKAEKKAAKLAAKEAKKAEKEAAKEDTPTKGDETPDGKGAATATDGLTKKERKLAAKNEKAAEKARAKAEKEAAKQAAKDEKAAAKKAKKDKKKGEPETPSEGSST